MMKTEIKSWDDLTLNELYEILHLRGKVFVVGQNCTCVDPDGKDLQAFHLLLRNDGKLTGYARLFPPGVYVENATAMGRVAVLESFRNQGLGKEIVKNGIDFLTGHFPGHPVFISAQTYLEDFYRNLGFETVSDVYMEENMPHIKMKYVHPNP
jgi:ElaA protein